MNFKQAMYKLKEGKKIRRPSWNNNSYWQMRKYDELICWKDGNPAKVSLTQTKANDWEVYEELKTENCKGGLWLTSMGRIVLDNHNSEVFSEPYDKKIMKKEELTNGIKFSELMRRVGKKYEK